MPKGTLNLRGLPPEAIGADPVEFMKRQFTGLLTRYGKIDEVWLDQGRQQKHALSTHVKSLQPNCVVLLNNDVGDVAGFELPNIVGLEGCRNRVGGTPAEVADYISPDGYWFWQKRMESNLLTAAEIADRVRYSNAHRANYLLDVPPNTSGQLPALFVERLREVGKLLWSSHTEHAAGHAP